MVEVADPGPPHGERILVVEPRFSGHLLVFVARLVEGLSPANTVVVLTTPESAASREYRKHLAPLSPMFELSVSDIVTPRGALSYASANGFGRVLVPHADGELLQWAMACLFSARRFRTRLLIMRDPRWESPLSVKRRLKCVVKVVVASAANILPNVDVLWLREPGYESSRPDYVNDPFIAGEARDVIRQRAEALRQELDMTPTFYWFGVTGAVTARKNVDLIVSALILLRRREPTLRFGFASIGPIVDLGRLTKTTLIETLRSHDIPVRVLDSLLSNEEMNAAVDSLDCVVMAYSSHSPNSTLGKAHALGVAVVVAGPPSVQGFASRLDLSFVSSLDLEELTINLGRAVQTDRSATEHFLDGTSRFVEQFVGRV